MDLKKHKQWVNDYMKKNYGYAPVLASEINIDNNCNLVLESWDSRLNIWKDQVPFMKKDTFCKLAELDSDREGSFCHYKFVFPFEYVNNEINKNKNEYTCEYALENGKCTIFSNQINKLVNGLGDQMGINIRLREAIAFATGRLDIVPQTNEGKLCIEVREYLLNVLKATEQK